MRSVCGLRGEAVINPKTSEDPDIWEVDLLQELGKFLLGQERTVGGALGVSTVLGWHEEFDTGSLCGLSEDFLRVDGPNTNSADHDIDTPEGSGNAGLVGVVSLNKLSTLGEPFRISRLDGFLLSEQ